MKCPDCGYENKEGARACKRCSRDLTLSPPWFPDIKWHLKTLGIIYAATAALYFAVSGFLKTLPKPYDIRNVPIELTPWLNSRIMKGGVPGEPPATPETHAPVAEP